MAARGGLTTGADLVAAGFMLIGLGFTALIFVELSDQLRRRIWGKVGR